MSALTLVRLTPDAERFSAWAARRDYLPRSGADLGYALHAGLKACLSGLAPQPFYWRDGGEGVQIFGYSRAAPDALLDAARLPILNDPALGEALAIASLDARAMPETWRAGARYSFETCIRPVVRSRDDLVAKAKPQPADKVRRNGANGRRYAVTEIDAVFAARVRRGGDVAHEQAYGAWLQARLAAGGVELVEARLISRSARDVLRRPPSGLGRRAVVVPGPVAVFRGDLQVNDPVRFTCMLEKGVGRHTAFGFGMLLLAPPGAL